MAVARRLFRHPRGTIFWKLNFFLHAFFGALLTLYLIVVAVSGSVLVFRNELQGMSDDGFCSPRFSNTQAKLAIPDVIAVLQEKFVGARPLSINTPTRFDRCYEATLLEPRGRIRIAVDSATGTIKERKNVVTALHLLGELHATLLVGRNGRIANGVGAILLLLVNLTGLVIWWNGPKLWLRGLRIDWRRGWRRINFDAHRSLGFWTVSVVSFWALSGIYFAWPEQTTSAVNRFSPLVTAKPPVVHVPANATFQPTSLANMIGTAGLLDKGARVTGIRFPANRRAPFQVLLQRGGGEGAAYADTLYFNPLNGSHLWTWRYGVNQSWGDFLIWLQIPLHFGTSWGLPFKILWASLGLLIPLLALTGALLYWNRFLRHRLHIKGTRP